MPTPLPSEPSTGVDEAPAPLFRRIDTVILRVADLSAAVEWYDAALGLRPVYRDDAARLAVLALDGTSLTLWEREGGEELRPSPATFPIFAADDAADARARLLARGVSVGPLEVGEGVTFFRFTDPDGNELEACEVAE